MSNTFPVTHKKHSNALVRVYMDSDYWFGCYIYFRLNFLSHFQVSTCIITIFILHLFSVSRWKPLMSGIEYTKKLRGLSLRANYTNLAPPHLGEISVNFCG
jgi:hypothetical protein